MLPGCLSSSPGDASAATSTQASEAPSGGGYCIAVPDAPACEPPTGEPWNGTWPEPVVITRYNATVKCLLPGVGSCDPDDAARNSTLRDPHWRAWVAPIDLTPWNESDLLPGLLDATLTWGENKGLDWPLIAGVTDGYSFLFCLGPADGERVINDDDETLCRWVTEARYGEYRMFRVGFNLGPPFALWEGLGHYEGWIEFTGSPLVQDWWFALDIRVYPKMHLIAA